jgi:hypothetical protein
MPHLRRHFLAGLGSSAGLLLLSQMALGQSSPTARPLPSPNAPNPNAPGGLDGVPMSKGDNNKGMNPQLALQVHDDVQKLYDLVLDLKKQVDSTDINAVLSLGIVKKAQQIEKLAKHIKDEAKG